MTKAVWGARVRLAGAVIFALLSTSCGDAMRQDQASSYLIIDSLEAASGAEESVFGGFLLSDVETVIEGVPSFFNDIGRVQFRLAMKDPGASTSPTRPTSTNHITVNRYHVKYIRTDGRNTQGVDVPYEFDGAMTVTVADDATAGFLLVRHQAKIEPPLLALVRTPLVISMIAEITFYGHDQAGRAVSTVGRINISFGNFGDPE